jgi:hypothetical protein
MTESPEGDAHARAGTGTGAAQAGSQVTGVRRGWRARRPAVQDSTVET